MYTFLGVVRVNFDDEKTGDHIQGWSLWLAEPAETPSVGLRPVKKWLNDEKAQTIFAPLGGVAACAKYAGTSVDVQVGLRGQVTGLKFSQK